ncbi:M15 family metallopeptidase [Undibacterium sp. TJN19]|uniref:M15 family metallopeptidase n=1 Tax=Undibacterium sp. TJN19 TaxID=3413055 RepID=UPI003BF28184
MYDIDYQIPLVDLSRIRLPHYQIPLDRQSPLFTEELVNVRDYDLPFSSWHAMSDGSNAPYHKAIQGSRTDGWLRKTFAEKLARINHLLHSFDVELLILDAYRSIECQRGLWAFYWERGRVAKPDATDEELRLHTLGYLRDPRNFDPQDARSFPIHSTGSSIDVVLRYRKNGQWLNMGSAFEEYSDVSATDYFERQLQQGAIDDRDERLWNRRLLHWSMSTEGLTNDPIFYWHHDWGNQIWIKVKKVMHGSAPDAAWYGYIADPQWEQFA